MNLNFIDGKRIIFPDVEILSPNSVQLTWKFDENEKTNLYDVEKKEAQEIEWTKVSKLQLSQGSAKLDELIDGQQCRFRLIPSISDKSTKLGMTYSINMI